MLRNIRYYWKSIIAILFILYLSFSGPATFDKVPNFTYKDKIAHFILYGGLTLLLILDHRKHKKNNISYTSFIIYCIIFPIVLGGLVEIFQKYFFFPRTAEWLDWLSDIIGVLVGWLVLYLKKMTPTYSTFKSK
ncbi:MAG: VanZ family protein [Paludibacter sp.]